MKFYYDFEHDELLTSEDLTRFYNELSNDEKAEYNHNINDYIECCMNYNNGCCISLETYEQELKDDIKRIAIDEFSIHDIVNKTLMLKEIYDFKAKHNG